MKGSSASQSESSSYSQENYNQEFPSSLQSADKIISYRVIESGIVYDYNEKDATFGEVEREARDYFKEKVYQTVVPRNVRLSEAPSHGVPVLIYDKACTGSKSYFSFTDEFISQESIIGSVA